MKASQPLLLNCDMGESLGPWRMGQDEEAMPLVDMANIACGFHASDPVTMTRTVLLAKKAGVRIGAHPSYPDLVGFGRRSMACSPLEIVSLVHYQIGALEAICRAQGLTLSYVKPHGALYNDMMRDHSIFRALLEAIADYRPDLPLLVLAHPDTSELETIAREFEVSLLFEAFADRAYDRAGFLVPRDQEGAVHSDPERILTQALRLAEQGEILSRDGTPLRLKADSLCVHGDNPESVRVLRQLRQALDQVYGKPKS